MENTFVLFILIYSVSQFDSLRRFIAQVARTRWPLADGAALPLGDEPRRRTDLEVLTTILHAEMACALQIC